MKAFIGLIVVLTGITSAPAAPTPGMRLRVIETSAEFAHTMAARFPGQVQTLSAGVVLVPQNLVREFSQISHDLTGHCGGFMDITGEASTTTANLDRAVNDAEPLPALDGKRDWVATLVNEVRASNIKDFVTSYSSHFTTRLASSPEGEAAPAWLRDSWQKMADAAGRTDIKVELVTPPSGYNQNSVRITIPGKDANAAYVILGAHLDSINHQDGGLAPGVDDDGSGISSLTETFRVLLQHKIMPNRTIQIFGYAAEELGLLGSRVIAEQYQANNARVRAVLQIDMDAFPGEAKTITFITDHTNPALTQWTEQLYGLYVGGQVREERCGYGCSDHASWDRYGYPAVMPFESLMNDMNGRIHSAGDVWDEQLDAEYAARFEKLAVAFACELSN